MTTNLLTLNEFLLVGLENQLAKIHLTPPTLLEILVSLMNMLPYLTKLDLSRKPVTITFVYLAVYGLTLILQLHVSWLPLSFKLPKSQLSHPTDSELSLVLLARTVVKAPQSCHITAIL